MKIAIIGGNRFTGKRLVEKLVDSHKVTLFNRSASGGSNVVKFDRDVDNINLNGFAKNHITEFIFIHCNIVRKHKC